MTLDVVYAVPWWGWLLLWCAVAVAVGLLIGAVAGKKPPVP
jgi:hypothetical protein